MKRTLALCLLCGIAASLAAQTPTVVEKAVAPVKAANAAKAAQMNAALGKPAPSNVKVVAVPMQSKPTAAVPKPAVKPAVIAVQSAAKPSVAVTPAKAASGQKSAPAKPTLAAAPNKAATPVVHAVPAQAQTQVKATTAVKAAVPVKTADPFNKKKPEPVAKVMTPVKAAPAGVKVPEKKAGAVVAVNESKAMEVKKPEPKKVSRVGRRDPFISPVVQAAAVGSGCSSGKRCLAIDQIVLRGVVRSENGMIAVVVNALDKAYFLRENDPVFNGYVTKITPDSIIFKETIHDRLGKELTRDVTKSISRPAA